MTDLVDFKVDLETARPNPFNNTQVLLGDSPRTAFTKHNDMIDALHALVNHVGPTAPSPTVAWMTWLDTSTSPPVNKRRNVDNTAWLPGNDPLPGSGGSVTQVTSKTTAVTLNKASGRITTHAAALAGGSVAAFTLNNTAISGDDCVVVAVKAGNATPGSYQVWTEGALNGSCKVCLRNATAGSLSEAVSLSFVVIRGATA